MERKTAYFAPALEKGLDILELLSRHGEPLTLTRIAEECGARRAKYSAW